MKCNLYGCTSFFFVLTHHALLKLYVRARCPLFGGYYAVGGTRWTSHCGKAMVMPASLRAA